MKKRLLYLACGVALTLTSCMSTKDAANKALWEKSLSGSQARRDVEKIYEDPVANAPSFVDALYVYKEIPKFFQVHSNAMTKLVIQAQSSKEPMAAMDKVMPLQLKMLDWRYK